MRLCGAAAAGKAPTFRLLVWAVDKAGEPITSVTYVVSEQFVVATKRVKHAIKSDIPSVVDHISKLVHIGEARGWSACLAGPPRGLVGCNHGVC